MSTYRAEFKQYQNQGLSIHFRQNKSECIIKCSKPFPCNYPESQRGLYLDVSIRESSKNEQNWSSFQNHVKQLFDEIVCSQSYPNSMVKINIFVIEEGQQIKSCIINGLWLLLLKIGISMRKSIYSWQGGQEVRKMQVEGEKSSSFERTFSKTTMQRIIYNLNDVECIIEGELYSNEGKKGDNKNNQVIEQVEQYKNWVVSLMKESLYR